MPRKSLACVCFGLLLTSLLPGQPPDKKPEKPAAKPAEASTIDPAVQRLIEQLGDLDFHKRDAAIHQLEALGAKALPALRAARKHADPEVRRRAADLIEPIESATLLAPKRVTLTLEKKTAAEAVAAIAKATGYPIDLTAGFPARVGKTDEKFDFHWKDATFWRAVDDVCRAAGLSVQQSFGDAHLRLQAQDHYAPFVALSGAFCLAAGGFQQTQIVDFSSFPRGGTDIARWNEMVFAFYVHSEPRLPLLNLGDPHIEAAYDNESNSLIPPKIATPTQPNQQLFGYRNGRAYYGGNRMLTLTGQVNLTRPSQRATSVKLLKGTVPATVLAEQKAEVVTDNLAAAKGKKFKVGTTTFTVEEVSETPTKQPQVRLTIVEDASFSTGPNDYTWMYSLWNRLEMYDEKGARMFNNGSSSGGSGPNHVNMTLTYAPGTKPKKLVYQVWTTLNCQIPFEFKGLPLP